MKEINKNTFDVILLDSSLPDSKGLAGLTKIKKVSNDTPILMLTGMSDESIAVSALKAGAQDYLVKGETGVLHRAIRYSLERVRSQRELVEAKKMAMSASAAKGAFLANMSHEIRTPLTAIIGFGEALVSGNLDVDESLSAAQTVLRNGKYLLDILNDILDISKIEAGKVEIEILEFSPVKIVEDVTEVLRLKAIEKGIELTTRYQLPIPKKINSDPVRLKQIVFNLLGNAVKFTDAGKVNIEISSDIDNEKLLIIVTDTGIGMNQEQIGKLFQPFLQADASTTRKFGGTGLGLSISKELANLLGGEVTVESRLGIGSTFTLSVKTGTILKDNLCKSLSELVKSDEIQKPEIVPTSKLTGRVLVAEDCEDNRSLIQYLLKKYQIDFEFAENGLIAIQKAQSQQFDLVLMDMQMPVMDGYDATQNLRTSGYVVPIVALTASSLKTQLDRCIESGCVSHLNKPFVEQDFFNLLSRYLKNTGTLHSSGEATLKGHNYSDNSDIESVKLKYKLKLPEKINSLKDYFEIRDWENLAHFAHRLAAAGMFDLEHVGSLSAELELAAKSKNANECLSLLGQLEAANSVSL